MKHLFLFFCMFFFGFSAAARDGKIEAYNKISSLPDELQSPRSPCPFPKLAFQELSFGRVTRYIDQHGIRNLNTLIECLPDGLFQSKHFSAIHDSRGAEASFVDADHPRILLFNDNADFVITFTGLPSSDDFEIARIMEFDAEQKQFRFFEIDFTDGVTYSQPSSCLACHALGGLTERKPIWGSYRRWTGAYGSVNDGDFGVERSVTTPEERMEYQNFLRFLRVQRLENPRYRRFIDEAVGPSPDRFLTSGNTDLTEKLLSLNSARLVRKFKQSRNFQGLKYLFASTFLGCQPDSQTLAFFERRFGPLYSGDSFYRTYLERRNAISLEDQDTRNIAMAIVLSNYFGVRAEEWDLLLNPASEEDDWYQHFYGRGPSFTSSEQDSRNHLWKSLLNELNEDPKIVRALHQRNWDDYFEQQLRKVRREFANSYRPSRGEPTIDIDFAQECAAIRPYVEANTGRKILMP